MNQYLVNSSNYLIKALTIYKMDKTIFIIRIFLLDKLTSNTLNKTLCTKKNLNSNKLKVIKGNRVCLTGKMHIKNLKETILLNHISLIIKQIKTLNPYIKKNLTNNNNKLKPNTNSFTVKMIIIKRIIKKEEQIQESSSVNFKQRRNIIINDEKKTNFSPKQEIMENQFLILFFPKLIY